MSTKTGRAPRVITVPAVAKKLKAGDIDIAILANPFNETGINTEILYKEPFMVALPGDHPLARKKKLHANDLLDDTMLLLKAGNCFRDQVVELCPSCINPPGKDNPIQNHRKFRDNS